MIQTIKEAYKQTEVGLIPSDWEVKTLGCLNPFITSGSRGWAKYYSDNGFIFVRITNMNRGSINLTLNDLRFVFLPENENEGKRTQLQNGDILISITADIGICSYIDDSLIKPAYINQHIALVRFEIDSINSRFISYFLNSANAQTHFSSLTDSGAKAGMSLNRVSKIYIAIPPTLAEQTAIATALSDADALISGLERLIGKKKLIKQGAMQKLLSESGFAGFKDLQDGHDAQNLNNPENQANPQNHDSDRWAMQKLLSESGFAGFKDLQDGHDAQSLHNPENQANPQNHDSDRWEVRKLGEVAELITKGTTPTSLGKDFQSNGINFIKIESLTSTGEIIPEKVAYIDESTHQLLNRSQLKAGDILFSIAGALGRVAVVKDEILPANTNQALAIVRLNANSEMDLKYLFIYLTSINIQKHILNVSVQGAQANLSLLNISQLLIEVPKSKETQTRIATILSDMDSEIGVLEGKLEKCRKLKQGMMQELLTGKIRLNQD